MQLTYDEALDSIIERTETGYTLASQDRLWIVFTHDLDSDGEHLSLRYNRLYPLINTETGERGGWSYELDMFRPYDYGVPVWTTRAEAEHFAMALRHSLLDHNPDGEQAPVYVMNLGDDARQEATIIGSHYGTSPRTEPKFKGSYAAWQAQIEMARRWAEEVSPHIYQ